MLRRLNLVNKIVIILYLFTNFLLPVIIHKFYIFRKNTTHLRLKFLYFRKISTNHKVIMDFQINDSIEKDLSNYGHRKLRKYLFNDQFIMGAETEISVFIYLYIHIHIWVFFTGTVYIFIVFGTTLIIFFFKFFCIFMFFKVQIPKIFNGTATNVKINSTCYSYGIFYLCGRLGHFESII